MICVCKCAYSSLMDIREAARREGLLRRESQICWAISIADIWRINTRENHEKDPRLIQERQRNNTCRGQYWSLNADTPSIRVLDGRSINIPIYLPVNRYCVGASGVSLLCQVPSECVSTSRRAAKPRAPTPPPPAREEASPEANNTHFGFFSFEIDGYKHVPPDLSSFLKRLHLFAFEERKRRAWFQRQTPSQSSRRRLCVSSGDASGML